jgi:hypothetical protein
MYKILLRHCAPKDCVEVVKQYVVADSELQVLNNINSEYQYGAWSDRNEEAEEFEIYDEDYNVIGTETYLERMLRLRGEFNDENASYEDAYYGVTHYGWDEGVEISESDISVLLRLGIAVDWRE